jgi:hypothetical protein
MIKDSEGRKFQGVIGNLPLDKKYKIVDFYVNEYSQCENCGKVIKNIFVIQDEDGKQFEVGSECVKRFESLKPSYELEYKRRMSRLISFIKWIKTECKSIVFCKYTDGISCYFYKREVQMWTGNCIYRCGYDYYKEQLRKFVPGDVKKLLQYEDREVIENNVKLRVAGQVEILKENEDLLLEGDK